MVSTARGRHYLRQGPGRKSDRIHDKQKTPPACANMHTTQHRADAESWNSKNRKISITNCRTTPPKSSATAAAAAGYYAYLFCIIFSTFCFLLATSCHLLLVATCYQYLLPTTSLLTTTNYYELPQSANYNL